MSRGLPSLTALLGLLAVAGYQNRDKIAEILGGPGPSQTAVGGGASDRLAGWASGGFLERGLTELIDRFRQNGHGDVAESWVGTGPNQEVSPDKLEGALGSDILQTLTERTGLSRQELLARLSRELPTAVDQYTPDGRLPAGTEAARG